MNLFMIIILMILLAIVNLDFYSLDDVIMGKDYLSWQMLASDFVRKYKLIFVVTVVGVFFIGKKQHKLILVGSSVLGYLIYEFSYSQITPW